LPEFVSADDFGRISSKLAEIFPNWPNLTRIGAEKTNHGSNFGQLGRYSTKIVAEIQLRAFDRF
jgi:hypothetical protein